MIIAMISWGVSWPAAKIVGQYSSPEYLIAWRFLFGLISMIFVMGFLKIPISFPGKALKYVLSASVLIIFYNYNYLKGTQVGISGLGGVIVPTISPIITFVLSAIFFKNKFKKKGFYGLLLGLCGSGILTRAWDMNVNAIVGSGSVYFFLGAVSWAFITILTKKSSNTLNPINFSFWVYSFGFIFALVFFPMESSSNIFSLELRFWINFILISSIALGLGTTAYFYTTMRLGPSKASSFMFIVPFSSILSSSIIIGEPVLISTIFGGFITIFAVYLVNN